jgi:branched-chain amino acid transport system ATP-binding protein
MREASNSDVVLRATDLIAGYEPGLPIVNGASIHVARAEIVVVLGPNGAGKSTLIKSIAGLVPKFGGTVMLGPTDITKVPAHRMVGYGLAFVPQTENVFTTMTVDDNLRLAAGVLKSAGQHKIDELYGFFPDLARQRWLLAGRLSGGQRQMLAVARALIVSPEVLMLDEPSAGLSPKLVEVVFEKLVEIRATGVSILLVEQNARAALAIADRAAVLVEGRNAHEGAAKTLADDPIVASLYLGGSRAKLPSPEAHP